MIRPRLRERREHRRARADDDVDVAAADALPLVVALAVGEAAVLDRDALAEGVRGRAPRPPASARFRAPASARRGPASRTARGEAQVDLGLAAAGDAVQQRRVIRARRRRAPTASSSAACCSGTVSQARRPVRLARDTVGCAEARTDRARLAGARSPRARARRAARSIRRDVLVGEIARARCRPGAARSRSSACAAARRAAARRASSAPCAVRRATRTVRDASAVPLSGVRQRRSGRPLRARDEPGAPRALPGQRADRHDAAAASGARAPRAGRRARAAAAPRRRR